MNEHKNLLYEQFSRIGKAISSPARLEILDLLAQSEKTVDQLADQARLGVKNASAHLRALRQARLVTTRKAPPWIYYRLADDRVLRVVRELQALARARLAEVEQLTRQYFGQRDDLEPLNPRELLRRVRSGEVTLLDVRPRDEYSAGHIPGAVSMPADELKRRLAEIPRGVPVIAYCRGPFCVYAVEAVEMLSEKGYDAKRVEIGVPEWRIAGLRVAQGEEADRGSR